MDKPRVSVVTPSYNHGEFIEDTILSVKSQEYPNIEHIVIDDGSTDETAEILQRYEDEYNLQYISEPDDGQADAINTGFELSTGEIVSWLNSDDVYIDTGVISRVINYFSEHNPHIIYGDICELDRDSNVFRVNRRPDFNSDDLQYKCFIAQPASFFKQEVVKDNKLNEALDYTMDYEYWLRLSDNYTFKHVPDVLAGFRRYSDQKSKTTAARRERLEMFEQLDIEYIDSSRHLLISGISWRLRSLRPTIDFYRTQRQLAFEGQFPPLSRALVNLLLTDQFLLE